ncbi:MAG: 16S rRNA (guanine(966)-N(2))-methyltransferase RsmD [Oscillospiraceae bacterium]
MRVISGDARGTRLETLEGEDTRPTVDRVKEGIFSAVHFALPGSMVLDLFAGSGQMGIEALSRGAKSCVFIDQNREATDIIQKNLRSAHLFEKARVASTSAESFAAMCKDKFDIVFLDPPYNNGTISAILPMVEKLVSEGGTVICETELSAELPSQCGKLQMAKQYKYGKVLVTRYKFEEDML